MNLRPYPEGIDCIWLASDRMGFLGAFVTGGSGPIPKRALDSSFPPLEDLEDLLCKLPTVSGARVLVSVERPDDFIDLAKRGMYVYDWTDVYRSFHEAVHAYEKVAEPSEPIKAGMLPEELAAIANVVTLSNVTFNKEMVLNVPLY